MVPQASHGNSAPRAWLRILAPALPLAFLCMASVGCGGPEATLQGVVTLDGKPLTRGTLAFVPQDQGVGASSAIAPDGSYQARTANEKGLPAGNYLVTVRVLSDSLPNPAGGPPMPGKLLTPPRYTRSSSSGLQVQVEPGPNQRDFELVSTR